MLIVLLFPIFNFPYSQFTDIVIYFHPLGPHSLLWKRIYFNILHTPMLSSLILAALRCCLQCQCLCVIMASSIISPLSCLRYLLLIWLLYVGDGSLLTSLWLHQNYQCWKIVFQWFQLYICFLKDSIKDYNASDFTLYMMHLHQRRYALQRLISLMLWLTFWRDGDLACFQHKCVSQRTDSSCCM